MFFMVIRLVDEILIMIYFSIFYCFLGGKSFLQYACTEEILAELERRLYKNSGFDK